MLRLFVFTYLLTLIYAETAPTCSVDNDEYNSTHIRCFYLKLDDKDVPLDGEIKPGQFLSVVFISCSGKINEASFPNLRNMTTLNIVNSDIEEFVLPNLPELDYISLKENKMPTLIGAFKNLKKLTGLDINQNNFTIEDNSFKGLNGLLSLTIVDQDVTLTKELLKDLVNLRKLSINNANITKISAGVFSENSELENLALEFNPITAIENGVFDSLTKLKGLFILHTPLENFDLELLKNQASLRELGVPARSIADLDLTKLLNYCPKFSTLHMLPGDSDCPGILKYYEEAKKHGKRFLATAFIGDNRNEKSC